MCRENAKTKHREYLFSLRLSNWWLFIVHFQNIAKWMPLHCNGFPFFFARFRLIYQIRRRKSFLYLNLFWFVLLPRFFFSIIFMQIELIHDAIHVFICKLNVLIIPCAQILWPSFMLHECVHLIERVSSPMTAIEWTEWTLHSKCVFPSASNGILCRRTKRQWKNHPKPNLNCVDVSREKSVCRLEPPCKWHKEIKIRGPFFFRVCHTKNEQTVEKHVHSDTHSTATLKQQNSTAAEKKMVVIIVHASKQILHEQTWVLVTARTFFQPVFCMSVLCRGRCFHFASGLCVFTELNFVPKIQSTTVKSNEISVQPNTKSAHHQFLWIIRVFCTLEIHALAAFFQGTNRTYRKTDECIFRALPFK